MAKGHVVYQKQDAEAACIPTRCIEWLCDSIKQRKTWIGLGSEVWYYAGNYAIIVKVLYSLKSASVSFKEHLAQYMCELRYRSSDAGPDPWIKAEYNAEDKLEYYTYILCYVDEILCIHHDLDNALNNLNGYVPWSMYLGTKLKCMQLYNGIWA